MFIVRLEKGVFLASWKGDPGRTLVKSSAKKFPTHRKAGYALIGARQYRPFENARILKAAQLRVEPTRSAQGKGKKQMTGYIAEGELT